MTDNTTPTDNRATPNKLRRLGTLYLITGCLFALAGLVSAIGGHGGQTATYVALCAVFLVLGRRKARQARQQQDVSTDAAPKA
jgi:hypothetical protein